MSTAIVSRAFPKCFQAWCHTASAPGSDGYALVGRQLAPILAQLPPIDVEDAEWLAEVERLETLLDAGDDAEALAWFAAHLPRCYALIPPARRDAFLRGFRLAMSEDEVEIASL